MSTNASGELDHEVSKKLKLLENGPAMYIKPSNNLIFLTQLKIAISILTTKNHPPSLIRCANMETLKV